jgi:CBS domain containing-hemolysin-like protein
VSTAWQLICSLLLLATNGLFVAAEFALVASKSHRLEETESDMKRSARAAAAASRQLSLTLAGAQLGITLCSLGLGALAEPAIAHLLQPLFHTIGLHEDASHAIAIVLALLMVVFLHMVIGEMAPKSLAITHPERAALFLALPFTAFNAAAKPLLRFLNGTTNAVLRMFGIHPQDELAQAHGPEELQMLLEQSRKHGTLPDAEHTLLSRMLRLQRTTVLNVMITRPHVLTISSSATDREIERTGYNAGRSRLAVVDEHNSIIGLVHVRDAVRSTTSNQHATAAELLTPVLAIDHTSTVAAAVETMRERRSQLAVVANGDLQLGVVGLEDLLEQILGQFDDETDQNKP